MSLVRIFAWVLLAAAVPAASAQTPAELPLLRAGRMSLPVRLPAQPAADERAAAEEWAGVWAKVSGASVEPAAAEAGEGGAPGVYLGATGPGRALLAAHPPGDADGFVISVEPERQRIILAGATPLATYFAVCWFLREHRLAEWYFPGELGEVVSSRRDWSVPAGVTVRRPAYLSREFSGLRTDEEKLWAKRNLLHARFAFHHNLAQIVPAAMFTSRPEFFPVREGARVDPRRVPVEHTQPNLANEDLAAWVAAGARIHFDGQPQAASYSLGINDNTAFDDSAETLALVGPRRWFRGRPDYSNLVFTFMNRAADYLARTHPDKYLGCLAYFWCEDTPQFAVHPQVLPYLTNDRSFYTDPAWRREDLALLTRWAHAGPKILGLYDYYYGQPFATPRVFTGAEILSLRDAHARGARAFYAELYPVWPYDALKAWLAARLLWAPGADAGALQAQFFQDLYGERAAAGEKFFRAAEAAWSGQPGPPRWVKGLRDPYHPLIFQPEQLLLPEPPAGDAATAARYRALRGLAEWSDLAVQFARAQAALAASPARNGREIAAGRHDLPLLAALRAQALHTKPPAMAGAAAVVFTPDAVPGFLLRAGEWARERGQEALLEGWLRRDLRPVRWGERELPPTWQQTAATLFRPRGDNLLRNPALHAEPGDAAPAGWEFAWREAEFFRPGPAPGGGWRVRGADWSVLWQETPVAAGRLHEVSFAWRGRIAFGSRVYAMLAFYDAAGKSLGVPWQAALPPGDAPDWLREGAVTSAPAGAASVKLLVYITRQAARDFLDVGAARVSEVRTEGPAPAARSPRGPGWFKG